MILACSNLKKTYGTKEVLKNITFNINEKDKVGLVGVNGAGKSTLFKLIIGEIEQDEGDVIIPKNTKIGYFSQTLNINENNTPFAEILTLFSHTIDLEKRLRALEKELENSEGEKLKNIADEHHKISTYLIENNSLEYKSRIKGVLTGLGFATEEFDKKIKHLSGGQKTRVALAKILLDEIDILLLDEPTNHLDIKSIQWLENFLKTYPKAVFIISHDRYFLNKIVTKVIEIENTKCTMYMGDYSKYSYEKQIIREIMLKKYLNQEKEIKKQQETIKKLRSFNREKSVKRARSREKLLDKMEKIEKPENMPDKMRIVLSPKKESGNDVLTIENVEKNFDKKLFSNISLHIKKWDKIALIGKNGIGKTTLIKMILGELDCDKGDIKKGSNVTIGYYDQEQNNLNLEKTIFEEISDNFPNLKNEEIRKTLAIFVFTGDDVFKKISMLSGGEKSRVALAKIMLSKANFLILDEPTNHLDMVSKEILETALSSYTGTYLYISHDRYFINKTANKIVELKQEKMDIYLGDYDYYLEKIQAPKEIAKKENSDAKTDWKIRKEIQAFNKKKEREIKNIEEKIEKIEKNIKNIDDKLSLEEIYVNVAKTRELFEEKVLFEDELAELYQKWEKISEDI